jgi:iodotyrosine deiodinase
VTDFEPLVFQHMSLDESRRQSESFLARMVTRRTVRDFSDEPVPFDLIENAIRTAGRAPSGANQQPWTFCVVSNPDLKRAIRQAAEAEERESYERRMSDEWLDAIRHLGTDWQKPHLEDAPYLVIVFGQAYALDPHGQKIKHYYVQESVGIAVGFLLASLHQAGLATLTHTPSPMKFLSEILNRPANERAYVVIPVGYPAEAARVPVIEKKPLTEILVHYD